MKSMTLAEVLEAYAVETPTGNDQEILQRWIRDYPQFAHELMDFAAARAIVKYAPEEELSADEERRYQRLGLESLQAFLSERALPAVPASLTDLAKKKGFSKAGFASALGLSVSLVMYLEKKRLEVSSIPRAVIRKIADLLETGEEAISAYLDQPPATAGLVSYKASARPQEADVKSFAQAVHEDQTLSPKEKEQLLQLK